MTVPPVFAVRQSRGRQLKRLPPSATIQKGGNSITEHEKYQELIKFRKENPIIKYGDYKEYNRSSKQLYVYERTYMGKKLLVICSYTEKPVVFKAPEGYDLERGKAVLCNYDDQPQTSNMFITRPFETRVYYFE